VEAGPWFYKALPLVCIVWLVLVIVASIKASEGKIHRYPLTIRLIK
jgi:uncharacterized Tic20 family protein